VFVVIDIAFKRPDLTDSLKGRQRELQTIYNPHHEHLYPVSLQVFIILSDCSSFWIIFQEPATFRWGIPPLLFLVKTSATDGNNNISVHLGFW